MVEMLMEVVTDFEYKLERILRFRGIHDKEVDVAVIGFLSTAE